MSTGKKYFHIGSLDKGMKVLELLAEHEQLSVTEVARQLRMNRAASHRFLATFRELGYVDKNNAAHYHLTSKILELGMKVAGRFEIWRVARPYLQELSSVFNETVNLGFFDGRVIVHLDKVESNEILRMDCPIGSRAPAYCTALGKAILAFLPENELENYLTSVELVARGPNTITSKEEFKKEILRIRNKGFAVDNEELTPMLRCVGAPVFDHTGHASYSVSIAGPKVRITTERIEEIQKDVRRICSELSAQLGGAASHSR